VDRGPWTFFISFCQLLYSYDSIQLYVIQTNYGLSTVDYGLFFIVLFMKKNRRRFVYFLLILLVITLGLSSRYFANYLPVWNKLYVGDSLWALMVFFMMGFLFKARTTFWVAVIALVFSYLIEFSQLYQATWINSLRANRIGGLVLGYGFLWSDLLCYTVGIAFGIMIEKITYIRKGLFKITAH